MNEPTPEYLTSLIGRDLRRQLTTWLIMTAKILERYRGTPHEATARSINRKIQEEIHRRFGYGD